MTGQTLCVVIGREEENCLFAPRLGCRMFVCAAHGKQTLRVFVSFNEATDGRQCQFEDVSDSASANEEE